MRVKNKCKRITALVLSAGLTLSMLPMTSMPVHAATTKVCHTVEELQAAVKDTTVDDIVIGSDLTITETIEVNREVTIRGEAGNIPKLTGNSSSSKYYSVFNTYKNVTFGNLAIDGNNVMDRAITAYDTCVLNAGVTLQNCKEYGLMTVGTTVMNEGVEIKDNNIGVCIGGIGETTFIMNGGTICRNNGGKGTDVGGGVYNIGIFTMNGGTICDNIAKYNGGGVRQPGGSVTNHNIIFTMNGGSITRNSSTKQGGGIYHETRERSYVELKGGSITNNTANEGGGVYYNNSSGLSSVELKMSGAVTIKDNTEKGIPSNVYLSGYAPIKISGALTGEKIGVRRDPASTLTIAQGSDYVISKSDLNVLQSDSEDHTLVLNQWGGVSLEERGTLAASDFVFEAPEDLVWEDTAKAAKVTARNGLTCGAITVKYYDSNGAKLTSAPKETGTYSVKIDVAASRDYKAASGISDSSWTYTIVPDTTAPQISGITQDKIYCGAVTATVTDKNLKEVTVDGNKVTLQDNRFTVSPKKGVQKIEASDKSGNKTTVSITVNNGHTKSDWIIDKLPTSTKEGSRHKECTVCGTVVDSASIPKLTPNNPENPTKPDPENPTKPDPEKPTKPDPENPTKPDPEKPTNPEKPTQKKYKVIEGADATYTINKDGNLTMRADSKYKNFKGIEIDGKTVDSKNYTAWSGSTYVKFKKDFVNTLSVGKHTVKFKFTDGYATTSLTIAKKDNSDTKNPSDNKKPDTNTNTSGNGTNNTTTTANTQVKAPKTGDTFQPILWAGILCVSVAGMAGVVAADKKRKKCQ